MKRILVIQTAFIGDVVLATGLLEKLHLFFPDAAIDILVRKGNESLFDNHPFLNKVIMWDKKFNKYRNLLDALNLIRDTRYNKIFNLQRYSATGLLTILSGAGETIGFDKNPFSFLYTRKIRHTIAKSDNLLHEIDRNHQLIEYLTDTTPAKPKLYPSEADRAAIAQYQTNPYICIAPASVWLTKQFPANKWIAFLKLLPAHYQVFLIGGSGDMALCDQIAFESNFPKVLNLAGQLSFLQSAALLESAVMNYVNDSAPLHFASAMNAPVAAIYCSTIPAFGFGPLSNKSFIIQSAQPLSCRPCGLHGKVGCPLKHFNCAKNIDSHQLLQVLAV